jgi:type I restriction enzyme S subunit
MDIKKGYKNTELGMIPEIWRVKTLNDVSKITRLAGYEYSTVWKEDENGEIIALRGFNIGKNKIIEREFVRISNELSLKLKRSRLYRGNVIYPCVGTIGNAVVIEENDKYHIQQNIAKITPDEDELNPYFLAHYLMSSFGISEIKKFNGSSSQPNILVGSLRNYSILLPTKAEQAAIATALSDIDELISQTEKLIDKKKAIKQGVMQELLKPKEGWVTKKLGNIAKFLKGKGLPKSHINEYGKFKCIHYGELFTKYKEIIAKILSSTDENDNCFYSQINDVLMPTSDVTPNGLATASCVKEDGIILGGDVLVIRITPNILDGIFLSYYISQNREKIMKLVSGSTVYHLYGSDMKDFEVCFPDITTQQNIIRVISDLDSEINILEMKYKKLKHQKQGMMQALLTGKIRLI